MYHFQNSLFINRDYRQWNFNVATHNHLKMAPTYTYIHETNSCKVMILYTFYEMSPREPSLKSHYLIHCEERRGVFLARKHRHGLPTTFYLWWQRYNALRHLWQAKITKIVCPSEFKWCYDTILSGNATGDNLLALKQCRHRCRVCPALQERSAAVGKWWWAVDYLFIIIRKMQCRHSCRVCPALYRKGQQLWGSDGGLLTICLLLS